MKNFDEIRRKLAKKIENKEFSSSDLEKYFLIFCEIGRRTEDFQEEIEDWNRVIAFDLEENGIYWIATKDGEVSTGRTQPEKPDLTLTLKIESVLKIFTGDLDPTVALLSGKLKVSGDLPDAMKFGELMEIVAEEIEYD